jgi:hypothetical protein
MILVGLCLRGGEEDLVVTVKKFWLQNEIFGTPFAHRADLIVDGFRSEDTHDSSVLTPREIVGLCKVKDHQMTLSGCCKFTSIRPLLLRRNQLGCWCR